MWKTRKKLPGFFIKIDGIVTRRNVTDAHTGSRVSDLSLKQVVAHHLVAVVLVRRIGRQNGIFSLCVNEWAV